MSSLEYRPRVDRYDEMVDGAGRPRPHWSLLADVCAELGPVELRRRGGDAARLLDQDGVVVRGRGHGAGAGPRAWRLDPLPHVVSSREWAEIEAGVVERAELLSMILADLYGPRELLRRGWLPAELVLDDPRFLRAADGLAGGLFAYAADLSRDADGELTVVADWAETPAGAGFALENRQVISRVLPTLYRDSQVHRLAPFFRALRAALQEAAPAEVEDPRIVVLTPGPLAETAFEHATLAATLGYPLVQGRDLVVREDRVWMQSVGQLEPVDVIFRRVESSYTDPLELRPDSQLGVPGLLEAARAGRVRVLNPPGTGILEHPGLHAFLPRLARRLLGTEPALRSTPTWWCGEPDARRYVLEHLAELVLLPVGGPAPGAPVPGAGLTRDGLVELRRAVEARPERWVAQAPSAPSTVPTVGAGGLESRGALLRTFAVARGELYTVMPGGLTRIATDPPGPAPVPAAAAGTLTKDTWVLASEPEPLAAYWLQTGPPVSGIDPMASIPAGAAESLWWLGRYAERAETLTRLTRTMIDRANEFAGGTNPAGSACLAALEASAARLADGPVGPAIAAALRALLDNAYTVRDQLSRDTWLILGPLEGVVGELAAAPDGAAPAHGALARVVSALLALGGLGIESMVRDLGWRFLDAGRRLERSVGLVALLSATLGRPHGTATDSLLLESVLSAAESIITYRFRYRSQAQLETVLDLLLLDGGNPRSLAFQLDRLGADLAALPNPGAPRLAPARRLTRRLATEVELLDSAALVELDADGARTELSDWLGGVAAQLAELGDAVEVEHFRRPAPSFTRLGVG